ncbi:MAG TPA: hypothetical protein VH275_09975 [Solirubrobacterales bacterium]|jgi:hypothetical protein|nr:hypothetical protein [Solirubrobacterales bacterium]
MITRKSLAAIFAAAIFAACIAAPAAAAPAPVPAWSIQSLAAPTNFKPGDESGLDNYQVFITNSGGEKTDHSQITIVDTLPAGLGVKSVALNGPRASSVDLSEKAPACETTVVGEVSTVTCKVTDALLPVAEPAKLYPGSELQLNIRVTVPPGATGELVNQVQVQGGGAAAASAEFRNQASDEEASAGFEEFHAGLTGPDGKPSTGAASHPYQYTTSFAVNLALAPPNSKTPYLPAGGDLKEIEVTLPPGLVGNPTATTRCSAQQFNTNHSVDSVAENGGSVHPNECPAGSAVGLAVIQQLEGVGNIRKVPVYNLVPPKGMPAQLGFQVLGLPFYINTKLRSDGDYGVTGYLHNTTEAERVTASQITIWGTPGDPSHDTLRGECFELSEGSCPANLTPVRPFFRLPSSCAEPLATTMRFDTWPHPGAFLESTETEAPPVGCSQPPFTPTIETKPSTNVADAPSGLHVDVHLPQADNEDPEGLGEADLRDATVTLPPDLTVNPSSANGRAACSLAEIGYQGVKEGKPSFSTEPANCPDASKIGIVEIDSQLVDHPIPGSIFLAKQFENPFNSLLALYIAVNDPITGVVIKLPGKVETNPVTGQITNVFEQNPQLPFEDLKVDLFQGARAPLRTPQTCGESASVPTHTTTTSLVPWTAPEGATAHPADSFAMAQAPGGGNCAATTAQLPNAPSFEAGTQDPLAGGYSPFLLRLKREDGSQELKGLNVSLPTGLIAKLAGTTECSAAGVAQAQSRTNPVQGALEQSSPSCPASSQLGTVTVGAGAGPSPFYAQGKAYLAGPYKSAPLSMLIVTPAVAGPFDLGSVAVRAALNVDPESAKVTVVSDPIPTILQGIPLDVRSIAVKIDKPDFTLNPTSCEVKALTAEAISVTGNVANLQNRFQVGGCQNLAFKPKLSFKLKGQTKRGGFPALTATLTYPSKGAYSNIARAQVALPHSEFLAQSHIKTICTRVQFAAGTCPQGSIYGKARAITPLLDKPLEGPVYLRSSSNPLPDLVADLNGQIHIVLVGRVDSVKGGIRNSFEAVPDAPVTKFTLSLPAGKKGLLENSTNICKGEHKANAEFTAQNGKVLVLKPELQAKCPKARKGKHKKHKPSSHRRP